MNNIQVFKLTLFIFVLAVIHTGCASIGRDFNYQNRTSLELGQPISSNYQEMFGKPYLTQVKETSEGKFEQVRYIYAHADMGTARSRVLDMEFLDGRLNAYFYTSSFDDDKTVVNVYRLNQIHHEESKMGDVLQLLGQPHGKALCPSHNVNYKDKCSEISQEIWGWLVMKKLSTFGVAFGGKQPEMNSIFISFDKNGVVIEVDTAQTKNE